MESFLNDFVFFYLISVGASQESLNDVVATISDIVITFIDFL
jgi:hypothetical protein